MLILAALFDIYSDLVLLLLDPCPNYPDHHEDHPPTNQEGEGWKCCPSPHVKPAYPPLLRLPTSNSGDFCQDKAKNPLKKFNSH